MYWGKSLDQCDPKACFGISFNLFNSNQQQNGINNHSVMQNYASPRKNQTQQILYSELKEKRSLKKCTSPYKTSEVGSLKSSTASNFYQVQQNKFQSPTKISVHRSPNKQVFLARQQLIQIEKQLKKLQTPEKQPYNQNLCKKSIEDSFNSISPRRQNENLKVSLVDHLNHQKNQQQNNFIKRQTNQVCYHQKSQFNGIQSNLPLKTSYQSPRSIKSPVKFTFQSPSKPLQPQMTQIIHTPIIISPRKVIVENEKKQSSNFFYQESLSPRKNIENICVKRQIVSQQFPTIREENEIYEQSRSEIESKNQIIQKSEKEENHKNQQEKTQQKQILMKQIKQLLFNGSQKQRKSVKFQQIPLSPRSQQTSVIGGINRQEIDLSCQQMMGLTQKKIPQQEEQKVQESFVQNMPIKSYSLSPSQQYYYERRPNHVPSIAIKLIENKLRSHNYQISETFISNQVINNNQNYSQQQESQNYQSKSNMQGQSRWKQLYEANSKTLTLSKQSNSIPFKLKIQQCKSQWISDSKYIENHHVQSLDSSLIEILTEEKQNSKQLQKQRIREFSHQNIIQANIFRDKTNLHTIHSDRHCSPLRKQADKKFKTLVNNKITIHSILQQDHSSSQIIKNPSQPQGILSRNLIENQLNNKFCTILQNIDHDQSTVIGKYTFQSMEQKGN